MTDSVEPAASSLENDAEIKKYLSKTKFYKLNINAFKKEFNSNKTNFNFEQEKCIYYNLKQIKFLLFKNEFNHKLFQTNFTNLQMSLMCI